MVWGQSWVTVRVGLGLELGLKLGVGLDLGFFSIINVDLIIMTNNN